MRVADAIRAHPVYVSGTKRDEFALLSAIPGAIGKAGAESCYAVALPDGRAFALKTDDGAPRVRPVLMAEALRRSGVDVEPGVDTDGGACAPGMCRCLVAARLSGRSGPASEAACASLRGFEAARHQSAFAPQPAEPL